jgi:aminopeptidase N
LSSLALWYSQAGTPTLTIDYSHDPATCSLIITLSQSFPHCSGPAQPCLIPCRTALFGSNGLALPLVLNGVMLGDECVLVLDQFTKSFHFTDVGVSPPVPSLLRGFSAPVNCVIAGQSDADLQFLLSHDTDGFNRNEVWLHVLMVHFRKNLSSCAGWSAARQALHHSVVFRSYGLIFC